MRKNFGQKSWFYPLAVVIVGSYDEDKKANAMNAAWSGIYDTDKVMVCLSPDHKTTKNIRYSKAFTLSFADAKHTVQADYVGIVSGNDEPDKVEKAGLHPQSSQFVNAPFFEEFMVSLDCELERINEDGVAIGKIINVSADSSVIGEDGLIDTDRCEPISYDAVHSTYRVLGKVVGKAFQDGLKLEQG